MAKDVKIKQVRAHKKARHIVIEQKETWLYIFFIALALAISWFLVRALYQKIKNGGNYYNNRGLRIRSLRIAFATCFIGVKMGLVLLLTKLLQTFMGCWAFLLAVLYCLFFIVLSLCGRNPARRLLDPVFL